MQCTSAILQILRNIRRRAAWFVHEKVRISRVIRRIVMSLVLTCLASRALAQDQPPELRDIAAAIADEQARVAELRAELERRSEVLADLVRRLNAITESASAPPPSEPVSQP